MVYEIQPGSRQTDRQTDRLTDRQIDSSLKNRVPFLPKGPTLKTTTIVCKYLFKILNLVFLRSSECDSLPLLRLLGRRFDINVTNARLYIKSLEKKVLEIIDIIKLDEVR